MADALSRTIRARIRLVRNGVDYHDQVFYEPDESYTETTHQRLILSTSMATPVEVDLAGVADATGTAAGTRLFLQTDRDILVAVNDITKTWPVNENGALLLAGDITSLFLQNESAVNQATVELIVTD